MTKEKTILKRVRKRIAKPENWCQKNYAMDRSGGVVPYISSKAVSWCLDGALRRECGDDLDLRDRCEQLLRKALQKIDSQYWSGYITFNDTRTHAEVLALLDAAIGA